MMTTIFISGAPCSGWWRSAAEKGMTVTADEVRGFLLQMDDDDEFDDIELVAVALAAIAGGGSGHGFGKC